MSALHLYALCLSVPAWFVVLALLIDELFEQSPRRIVQSQLPGRKLAYFKPYGYDRRHNLAVFLVAIPRKGRNS